MATALVTGASAGLGAELARLFAADRHDLVLVARRRERLEALAGELSAAHGVKAQVIACDLSAPDGGRALLAEVERLRVEVDFLVNNAGVGSTGRFAELDPEREQALIRLNILSLVELTRALLPPMLARRRGRILNLGSTAGFAPGPFMASYYASKAFVNSFSEALSVELDGTGVTVTVSCPGATETEFAAVAGNDKTRLFKGGAAAAGPVAREAYRAMHAGRPMVVHGARNKLLLFFGRFSPRSMTRSVTARLNRPPDPPQLPS
jgi:short-subunit dehydrogenase